MFVYNAFIGASDNIIISSRIKNIREKGVLKMSNQNNNNQNKNQNKNKQQGGKQSKSDDSKDSDWPSAIEKDRIGRNVNAVLC